MFDTIQESVNAYNEMLDDCYPVVVIGDNAFDPSRILEELDPCAYKMGWIDYMDSLGVDTDRLERDYTFARDRY